MVSLKAKSGEDSGGHLQPHVSKEKEKEKAKPKKKEEKTYRPGSKVLLGELRAKAFVPMHAAFALVMLGTLFASSCEGCLLRIESLSYLLGWLDSARILVIHLHYIFIASLLYTSEAADDMQ